MSPLLLFIIILSYFSILMVISQIASRHAHDSTFFDGDRASPWFLVAFGMIGSGISAVSLVQYREMSEITISIISVYPL